MAVSAWKVIVSLNAVNMTSPAFQGMITNINEAESSQRRLQSGLAALRYTAAFAFAAIGRAGLEGFKMAADAAGDLQLKLSLMRQTIGPVKDLAAVMSNLYTQQIALSTGPQRTLFDMNTIADIEANLLRTGNDPRLFARTIADRQGLRHSVLQEIAYMAEIENLQTHGALEPATTAKNLGGFFQAYGIGRVRNINDPHQVAAAVRQAESVANMFSKVASITPYTSENLRTTEVYFGTLARRIGIKPETMIELGGYLSMMGQRPSQAATGLANLFINATSSGSSSSASTPLPESLQAKLRLHFLDPANAAVARANFARTNEMLREMHLPTFDPTKMTAAQQERMAEKMLYQSMDSRLINVIHTQGFAGFAKFLDTQRARYEREDKAMGRSAFTGDQRFMSDLRTALNIRGMREANTMDYVSAKSYMERINRQDSLDKRISDLRSNTLVGAEKSLGNQFKTLMVQLGGVGPMGKPIAGGPLDVMTKFLHSVNDLMSKVNAWGSVHPGAIAKIGTMIGIIGVLGMLGSAVMAIMATVAMFSALTGGLGPSILGEAMGLGMLKRGGGLLGRSMLTNPFRGMGGWIWGENALRDEAGRFVRGPRGMFGGLLNFRPRNMFTGMLDSMGRGSRSITGGIDSAWDWLAGHGPGRDAMGRFTGGARGMFGGAVDSNLMRFTSPLARAFAPLARMFGGLAPIVGRLAPLLGGIAMRFLGIVGWVTLVIDALSFFQHHPKDIGHWIADIVIFFRDTLLPGFKNIAISIGKWLWGYIVELVGMLKTAITNPGSIVSWFKSVANTVAKDINAHDAKTHPRPAHHAAPGHHQVAYAPHVEVKVTGPASRDTLKAFHKQTVAALDEHLARAIRSGFGFSPPGNPYAASGRA